MSVPLRSEEASVLASLYGGEARGFSAHGREYVLLSLAEGEFLPQRVAQRGPRFRRRSLDFFMLEQRRRAGGVQHVLVPQRLRPYEDVLYGLVPRLAARDLSDPLLLSGVDDTLPLLSGMVSATQELHAEGVLHLDLRLENFLYADGEVFLVDLEESRRPHRLPPRSLGPTDRYRYHWPPEKLGGGDITAASDVYMLAAEYRRLVRLVHGDRWLAASEWGAVGELIGGALAEDPAARPSLGTLGLASRG